MVKIYLGSDHGGYKLKERIKNYLSEDKKYDIEDLGTYIEDSCDYPDYACEVACRVAKEDGSLGILFCGTGIGMTISANKIKGIRAALVYDEYTAKMSKEHNDANIITMGGRTTTENEAIKIVDTWLSSKFEGDRHKKRLDKIKTIEDGTCCREN